MRCFGNMGKPCLVKGTDIQTCLHVCCGALLGYCLPARLPRLQELALGLNTGFLPLPEQASWNKNIDSPS